MRLFQFGSLARLGFEVKKIRGQFAIDIYPDFVTKDSRYGGWRFVVAVLFVVHAIGAGSGEYVEGSLSHQILL